MRRKHWTVCGDWGGDRSDQREGLEGACSRFGEAKRRRITVPSVNVRLSITWSCELVGLCLKQI